MNWKALLIITRLAPFGLIFYELFINKLPASYVLPILWIEELLSLPMIILIAVISYTRALGSSFTIEEGNKIKRAVAGSGGTLFLYLIFFIAHSIFMIAGNWRITVLEAGGEKVIEPIMLTIMNLLMSAELFPDLDEIDPAAVSFMHRSFFIMSIFHLGELVFNVRKIKSARDYALAISWQSQPLVLNHLIIVFGGFLIFAQEIIGFSAYIIFLALYAIRFLNIFGFFQLKVKTKYEEIESMEKMRTESVEGLMQKAPLIERELVVDYTPIDFWNRLLRTIGDEGENHLLFMNTSGELKPGSILAINLKILAMLETEKEMPSQVKRKSASGLQKYLKVISYTTAEQCLIVLGSAKQALYIDLKIEPTEKQGQCKIRYNLYLEAGKWATKFLELARSQFAALCELRERSLIRYLQQV